MKLKENDKELLSYVDYPPIYDVYKKQKIDKNLQAGVGIILRILYGKASLCPNLPGMFIDITQYKHMIADEITMTEYKNKIKTAILKAIPNLNPSVEINFNKALGDVSIEVLMHYKNEEYALKLDKVQDKSKVSYSIDRKKFYE